MKPKAEIGGVAAVNFSAVDGIDRGVPWEHFSRTISDDQALLGGLLAISDPAEFEAVVVRLGFL